MNGVSQFLSSPSTFSFMMPPANVIDTADRGCVDVRALPKGASDGLGSLLAIIT